MKQSLAMQLENPSQIAGVLIRGARVIDPSQNIDEVLDIWTEGGVIRAIEKSGHISPERVQVQIDAKSLWALPGFIDLHVHLREPGLEYKETIETGTLAAAAGGFTAVACMANTQPVNDNPIVTSYIREKARQFAHSRVHIIGAVTRGLQGKELAEIGGMVREGAVALSDDGMPVMNSLIMRRAMEYAGGFGIPIISHAEDANLVNGGVVNESPLSHQLGLPGNPAAAEEIMVAREIALCRLTRTPIHIAHLSTAVALEHVRRAKQDGLPVTAEASPHHLTLTEEAVRDLDTNTKMAPPLRSEQDVEALRKAVAEGVVDILATDHAPHGTVDKECEFVQAANGILGLQTAAPLTYELVVKGLIPLHRWIESWTIQPAKFLKLNAGNLRVGGPADITLFDPEARWTLNPSEILSKSHNTPFLGWTLHGRATHTLTGGVLAYQLDSPSSSRSNSKKGVNR